MKLEFEIDDNLIPEEYTARIGVPKEGEKVLTSGGKVWEMEFGSVAYTIILDKKPVLKEIRFTPSGPYGWVKSTWAWHKDNQQIIWIGEHSSFFSLPLKMEVIWE